MTATQEQLDALTVPATLPGVVRRGTPVRVIGPGTRAVVIRPAGRPPGHPVRYTVTEQSLLHVIAYMDTSLAVDLTDATGRAHVAWAIAASVKHWPTAPDYTTATWRAFRMHKASVGLVECIGLAHSHYWPWTHHTIAHLDPSDDTRLPDGSRLVDALALQAIALHVLGTGGAA